MLFSIVPTLAIILSSAVVPSALAADHQVIVGGPGVLQFNPSTVVRPFLVFEIVSLGLNDEIYRPHPQATQSPSPSSR